MQGLTEARARLACILLIGDVFCTLAVMVVVSIGLGGLRKESIEALSLNHCGSKTGGSNVTDGEQSLAISGGAFNHVELALGKVIGLAILDALFDCHRLST